MSLLSSGQEQKSMAVGAQQPKVSGQRLGSADACHGFGYPRSTPVRRSTALISCSVSL